MVTKYLFIDCETANPQGKICSIGYFVDDAADGHYTLIDPEDDFFWFNTRINHIEQKDVAGKPTFPQFCEESDFLSLLEDYVVVGHNVANADLHYIRKTLAAYGIAMPRVSYVDTYAMALADKRGLQANSRTSALRLGSTCPTTTTHSQMPGHAARSSTCWPTTAAARKQQLGRDMPSKSEGRGHRHSRRVNWPDEQDEPASRGDTCGVRVKRTARVCRRLRRRQRRQLRRDRSRSRLPWVQGHRERAEANGRKGR